MKLFFETMRLSDETKLEFNDIKARLRSISDGEYLDRSFGPLGELNQEIMKKYLTEDNKIFMGPLQIQERGY